VPKTSVAILGVLDGVHLGHQQLIKQAVQIAEQSDSLVVVVSFDPHPATVLQKSQPELLCTLEQRKQLLIEFGADRVIVLNFNEKMMHQLPEEFIAQVLQEELNAVAVVVGEGYRFGFKAQGTAQDIRDAGIAVTSVPHIEFNGGRISSTRIRQAIKNGLMDETALMLGRPYTVFGEVVQGDQRGRELGFPTANLKIDSDLLIPQSGVYAAFALLANEIAPAVVSVGANITFGGTEPRVEAHLIDQSGLDLYGTNLGLSFIERIRPMLAFDSQAALISAMERDRAQASTILADTLPPDSNRN